MYHFSFISKELVKIERSMRQNESWESKRGFDAIRPVVAKTQEIIS